MSLQPTPRGPARNVESNRWLSKVMSYRIQPVAERLGIAKAHIPADVHDFAACKR
jgi:hypothetical protein